MSDCPHCTQQSALAGGAPQSEHVPDFATHGFTAAAPSVSAVPAAAAHLANVQALKMSVCVGASYNPGNNQICFVVPIYGSFCVNSPISIPVGAQIKACAQTCGSFIPTGLKVSVYVNGSAILTQTLVGSC